MLPLNSILLRLQVCVTKEHVFDVLDDLSEVEAAELSVFLDNKKKNVSGVFDVDIYWGMLYSYVEEYKQIGG